jgi:hypothetical protein
MRRPDRIFIFLSGVSLALLGLAVAENMSRDTQPSPAAVACPSPELLRQEFIRMGLPLHEGKYWRTSHE